MCCMLMCGMGPFSHFNSMNNFVNFVNRKQFFDAPGNGKIDIDNIVHDESLFNEHATTHAYGISRFIISTGSECRKWNCQLGMHEPDEKWIDSSEIWNADSMSEIWLDVYVCTMGARRMRCVNFNLRVKWKLFTGTFAVVAFSLCFALQCLCFPIPYDAMRCVWLCFVACDCIEIMWLEYQAHEIANTTKYWCIDIRHHISFDLHIQLHTDKHTKCIWRRGPSLGSFESYKLTDDILRAFGSLRG